MTVAVCVPWRDTGDRARRLAWQWCRARWALLHPDWAVVTGTCPPGLWSTAAALNDAVARTDADIVLLAGADTILAPVKARQAVAAATDRWVMAADQYRRLDQATCEALFLDPPTRDIDPPVYEPWTPRLGCGPLAMPRHLAVEIGWDPRFVTWGAEDEAFGAAASTLAGPPVQITGSPVWLTWHPRDGRHHPVHYQRNLQLLRRYQHAQGDERAMRRLVAERADR